MEKNLTDRLQKLAECLRTHPAPAEALPVVAELVRDVAQHLYALQIQNPTLKLLFSAGRLQGQLFGLMAKFEEVEQKLMHGGPHE